MIFDKIIEFLINGFASLIQQIPPVTPPSWYNTTITYYQTLFSSFEGLRNWMNLVALQNAVTFLLACYAFKYSVQLVRMVISLVSGGGGKI